MPPCWTRPALDLGRGWPPVDRRETQAAPLSAPEGSLALRRAVQRGPWGPLVSAGEGGCADPGFVSGREAPGSEASTRRDVGSWGPPVALEPSWVLVAWGNSGTVWRVTLGTPRRASQTSPLCLSHEIPRSSVVPGVWDPGGADGLPFHPRSVWLARHLRATCFFTPGPQVGEIHSSTPHLLNNNEAILKGFWIERGINKTRS